MKTIYLDYNATTPVLAAARDAMYPFLRDHYGNPSSGHLAGRIGQEAVADARSRVAAAIGADREEIVFTSGGTESNNMALLGVMLHSTQGSPGHLVISAVEHPAISAPAEFLRSLGVEVTVVPCDSQGVVSAEKVASAIRPNTRLVSIMFANNETGVVQPIKEIADICKSREVLFHTDAAQALGKLRIQVNELGVDLLSLAGHKAYAPKGVGALYTRQGTKLRPIMFGADHEQGMRPGTENVSSIVALGIACEDAVKNLDESVEQMGRLRDRLQSLLCQTLEQDLEVHGYQTERLPNTLSIVFPGVHGSRLLEHCPEVCASTGSACHSGSESHSPTLDAMGVSSRMIAGTVRLSLGKSTTELEVERAASLLAHAWDQLTGV